MAVFFRAHDFVGAQEFFATLRDDERVYFLVRHGERGHIMRDDPHHGEFVGLTEHGREQAFALGQCIPLEGGIEFYSSPVGRCVETAEFIGRGRISRGANAEEAKKAPIAVQKLQPLAEFFVEHYEAYMETHRTGFYQGICRWLDGTAADTHYIDPAYYPLEKRSNEMLGLMLENGHSRFNIFATHDAWIVPCLAQFTGLKFTCSRWMNFLTGMAVVVRNGACNGRVPDISDIDRIVPVTGLDTGWLLFK